MKTITQSNTLQNNKKKIHKKINRPQTPYFLFCSKVREDLKKKGDNKKMTAKQLGLMWLKLSVLEKKPYYDEYSKNKNEYDKMKEELNKKSNNFKYNIEDNDDEENKNKKINHKKKAKINKSDIDINNLKACNCGKCEECKKRRISLKSKNEDNSIDKNKNNFKIENKNKNRVDSNLKQLIPIVVELFKKKTEKVCYTYFESEVKNLDIFDDKIGGKPYLPEGISYPKDSSGENMALLLQINLSKYKLDGFPQKGFFEIFVQQNLTINCEYKIFLFDENLEYQKNLPEINYINFICKNPIKLTLTKDINYMNKLDINFEPTIIECINEVFKQSYKSLKSFYLNNKINEIDFLLKFEGKGFHSCGLGSWPDFIDNDKTNKSNKDYINIFQFHSGQFTSFGNCGYAWVLINKDDLKKGNFKNAIFEWDSL